MSSWNITVTSAPFPVLVHTHSFTAAVVWITVRINIAPEKYQERSDPGLLDTITCDEL